ncbi:MAG: hypothetical protein ACRDS0_29325 [Pseudonocardiaceae bacterium]
MRALLRVVMLGGLLVVGWLLASGTSHADEDLGVPGTGLVHVVNAVTPDAGSGDEFGTPAAVGPAVKKVLSTASVPRVAAPRPPVQPPVQAIILQPIVKAVGVAQPLSQIAQPLSQIAQPLSQIAQPLDRIVQGLDQLLPVSRPLSVPAQHTAPGQHVAAVPPATQAGKPGTLAAAAPAIAGKSASPAAALAPVSNSSPAVLCPPTQPATKPVTAQPALGDDPASPMPANSPVSTTSLCAIGAAGGGTSSKNGPDAAVHDRWMADTLARPYGFLDRDTSGLPRSLSERPTTSPD